MMFPILTSFFNDFVMSLFCRWSLEAGVFLSSLDHPAILDVSFQALTDWINGLCDGLTEGTLAVGLDWDDTVDS